MFIVKFGKGFKILHKLVMICIFRAIMDILTINVLYASFSFGADFDILVFISNCSDVFSYVSWHSMMISYSNTVTNPIIAATQVTFIHSITNFGDAFPKFYTFWLIDIFGVFTPNFVGCILSLAICFGLYNKSKDPDLYKIMEVPGLKQKIE